MGMGFAPTWLRQVSPPPASQNHFNHWFYSNSTALQPFDNRRYDCRLSYARAAALRNYIRQPDCVLTAAVILAVATLLDRLHANHGELIYHHVILNVYIRCLRKVSRMFFATALNIVHKFPSSSASTNTKAEQCVL